MADIDRTGVRTMPLVFGIAFVAVGISALVGVAADLDVESGWIWAVALAAVGVALIASAIARVVRRGRPDQQEQATPSP